MAINYLRPQPTIDPSKFRTSETLLGTPNGSEIIFDMPEPARFDIDFFKVSKNGQEQKFGDNYYVIVNPDNQIIQIKFTRPPKVNAWLSVDYIAV